MFVSKYCLIQNTGASDKMFLKAFFKHNSIKMKAKFFVKLLDLPFKKRLSLKALSIQNFPLCPHSVSNPPMVFVTHCLKILTPLVPTTYM